MTSNEEKQALFNRQSGRCFWCGLNMLPVGSSPEDPLTPTVEHVIPKAAGGDRHGDNLKVSCHSCNRERSTFNPGAYLKAQRDKINRIARLNGEVIKFKRQVQDLTKTNQRLSDVIINHIETPWWKKLIRRFNENYGLERHAVNRGDKSGNQKTSG